MIHESRFMNYVYLFEATGVIVVMKCPKFILRNLSGQSIRTSMRNLESVAQKMAELLH